VCGIGRAQGYGDGVSDVGSSPRGSPVGNSPLWHDGAGVDEVERVAPGAGVPRGGDGKHGELLGTGVQCSGGGMGTAASVRAASGTMPGRSAAEPGVGAKGDPSDLGESAGGQESTGT